MGTFLPNLKQTRILAIGDIMLSWYVCVSVECISPEALILVVHVHIQTCRLSEAGNVTINLAGVEYGVF